MLAGIVICVTAAPPTVNKDAVYGVNTSTGTVYAQGLYCDGGNFSQTNCTAVNLTIDILRPTFNATTKVPLPKKMPVFLGIHGGSYSHGGSNEEWSNAEYFVKRGWLGLSINYRLCNGGYTVGAGGNLVCTKYGNFPAHGPFGNSSCGPGSVKTFGINTADGCALSAPPKNGSFFGTLLSWMYPAMRDAKAAVRWIRANANDLNADADFITAIGGSAGACSVVGLATAFEEDYKTEMTLEEDNTLSTTHLNMKSNIATGLVQWGGDYVPIFSQLRDPAKRSRYTKANAPLATYHGSNDGVISPKQETTLKAGYATNGVPYEQHLLKGYGHGADAAPVTLPNGTNQSQHDNMFEFVTRVQKLGIEIV